jgi:protein-S-isoprenylcysteine O-methyltransferase Ste14
MAKAISLTHEPVSDHIILPRKSKIERYRKAVNVGLYAMVFLALIVNGPANRIKSRIMENIGYMLLVFGIAGRIWCGIYVSGRKCKALSTKAGICLFGKREDSDQGSYVFGRKSKELCTEGPYSICRNPLYLSSFLCGIGVAAQANSIFAVMAFGILFWCYYLQVIKAEEKGLRELFREDYIRYCNKVPRILPNVRIYKTRETMTVFIRHYTPVMLKNVWPVLLALTMNMVKLFMELLTHPS